MGIVHTSTTCEIHRQPVVNIPAEVYFHSGGLLNISSCTGKLVIDNATDWPPVPNRTGVRGRGYLVHDALLGASGTGSYCGGDIASTVTIRCAVRACTAHTLAAILR